MDTFLTAVSLVVSDLIGYFGDILSLFATNVVLQLMIGIMITGVAINFAKKFINPS